MPIFGEILSQMLIGRVLTNASNKDLLNSVTVLSVAHLLAAKNRQQHMLYYNVITHYYYYIISRGLALGAAVKLFYTGPSYYWDE